MSVVLILGKRNDFDGLGSAGSGVESVDVRLVLSGVMRAQAF